MLHRWASSMRIQRRGVLGCWTVILQTHRHVGSAFRMIPPSIQRTTTVYPSVYGKDEQNRISCCTLSSSTSHNQVEGASSEEHENPGFATSYHAPVMWKECIDALLDCQAAREPNHSSSPLIFVDGTLGGGGHSNALLERLGPGDIVFGCDVDPDALQVASDRLQTYTVGNEDKPIFIPVQSNFCDLAVALRKVTHPNTQQPIFNDERGVDGFLLDFGVSSYQIDTADRGFAFMKDGPLDMRMNAAHDASLTAANICNEFDTRELQRILSKYGDEPRAKTIAKAIVDHRPLETTGDLVNAVASVTPQFGKKGKRMGRTATLARVFQSLRIVVNKEEAVLQKVLAETAPTIIRPGGRLVVLSYHSMEDRATKRIMRDGSLDRVNTAATRDMYGNYQGPTKPFAPVGKKRKASAEELDINTRARSATLRVAERLG